MIVQELRLRDCVWECPSCLAQLSEGRFRHEDSCRAFLQAADEAAKGLIYRLRATIRDQQRAAEKRNRELDALHLVWCDGSCPSGVHRWASDKVTRQLVEIAERNTKRLRSWYDGVKWRLEHYTAGTTTMLGDLEFHASEWHERYARKAAARTDLLGEDSN